MAALSDLVGKMYRLDMKEFVGFVRALPEREMKRFLCALVAVGRD